MHTHNQHISKRLCLTTTEEQMKNNMIALTGALLTWRSALACPKCIISKQPSTQILTGFLFFLLEELGEVIEMRAYFCSKLQLKNPMISIEPLMMMPCVSPAF
jgi:hypothetical protein